MSLLNKRTFSEMEAQQKEDQDKGEINENVDPSSNTKRQKFENNDHNDNDDNEKNTTKKELSSNESSSFGNSYEFNFQHFSGPNFGFDAFLDNKDKDKENKDKKDDNNHNEDDNKKNKTDETFTADWTFNNTDSNPIQWDFNWKQTTSSDFDFGLSWGQDNDDKKKKSDDDNKNDNDNENDNIENTDDYGFTSQPVAVLKGEELDSGDQNDNVLCSIKAKIYKLEKIHNNDETNKDETKQKSNSTKYYEKGVGMLKITTYRNSENDKPCARIICRRDEVHTLIVNMPILKETKFDLIERKMRLTSIETTTDNNTTNHLVSTILIAPLEPTEINVLKSAIENAIQQIL